MFDPTPPPTSPTAPSITIHALLVDFRVLVLLFVFLRLLVLMAYPPVGTQGALGLTVGGDRLYHYQLAQLSANGDLPFRDWWSEFPPIWPWLGVMIFRGLNNAPFAVWTAVISVILLLFDVGNLWLVRAIGSRAYGRPTGVAVAWCYALLALPLIQLFWHFETMAAFWMLLGLWWLIGQRDARAGIAIALGALTKLTPALLLGAALRYRPPHKAVLIVLIAVLIFAGAYGLLLVGNPNPEVTLTSLTAQFRKASYGSVWALIDGNLSAGELAFPGEDAVLLHYDLSAASELYGRPPRVPAWLRLGVALMVGAFCFIRARRSDSRAVIAFVLLTLLIFFIQAQGWSPHWLVQILPLTLLCFPTRAGVLVCLALSALSILETPLLFTRIATEGALVIDFGLLTLYAFSIVTRTAIMVGLCAALYRVLRGR